MLLVVFLHPWGDESDSAVFPRATGSVSPTVARTAREYLHLSQPSGEEKTVRLRVDGILRGQQYNAVSGNLDFLNDEGEVVARVPFHVMGLADGPLESSTSEHRPDRRAEDVTGVELGPGLKLSEWRSEP
ncbi:hypothetical protein ACYBSK_24865 [Streptomyces sp. BYX5S]